MATSDNVNILFRLLGDSKGLQKATKQGQSSLDRMKKSLGKVAAVAGVAFGAQEVLRFAQDAVQLAVAAEEVDSKFQAVYGTATDLTRQLEAWGDMAGVTTTDAKEMAATFGNLAMAQGISEQATSDLAIDVAQLAGDMASFNDADPAVVFADLNKALLTTEREGMKKYGIAISEAEVKTLAAARAAQQGRTEVTKADRAYASYSIAVQQAGKAIGDLEKTQDSTANQQRQLNATLREAQEEIGRELLPVYAEVVSALASMAKHIGTARDAAKLAVNPFADFGDTLRDVGGAGDTAADAIGWVGDKLSAVYSISPVAWVQRQVEGARDVGASYADIRNELEDLEDEYRSKAQTIASIGLWKVLEPDAAELASFKAKSDQLIWALNNIQSAYENAQNAANAPLVVPGAIAVDDRLLSGGQQDFGDARENFERINGPR